MASVLRGTTRAFATAGVFLGLTFAAGCGDDDAVLAPPVANQLTITGGNNQVVPVSTASSALEVTVVDQYDDPIAGITVNWAVLSGSGTLASATSITNVDGKATVIFTAGTIPGQVVITATVTEVSTVPFTLTVQ